MKRKTGKLVVKVFYRDDCPRCHGIFDKFEKVKALLPPDIKIKKYNLNKRYVRAIARKLCIRRIPAIALYNSVYFVGIPDDDDLIKMINYVYKHPEHAFTDELSK